MKKLHETEPMNTRPKDCKNLFWESEPLPTVAEEHDLYIGAGATYCPYGITNYPYSIVDITGELGNRLVKLRECDYKNGSYYDRPEPSKGGNFNSDDDGYIYIKEQDLSWKQNGGIRYSKVYIKSLVTGRFRKHSNHGLIVGYRLYDRPREL
jgi:hypothetical protein